MGESTGIKGLVKLPKNYALTYNGSRIVFQIPEYADKKTVSVKLFNVQGKLVRTLVKGPVSAGSHSVGITMKRETNALAAGLYLCRMEVGSFTKTITILVRK
jgi:predicted RNA-binding protein with EMAP domain